MPVTLRRLTLEAMETTVMRTLAHLSDVHIGRSAADAEALRQLVAALEEARVDQVVVTGDVTHRGRLDELAMFQRLTAPLAGRLTVVPGNHDRLGDDAGRLLMRGRVAVERREGLHLIRLDSTAPHNRRLLDGHGRLLESDIEEVAKAAGEAAPEDLVAVLLHHHVHPLPGDDIWERLSDLVGLPFSAELATGRALLERIAGRCDLVLHGHRHVPAELVLQRGSPRPVRVVNAGCSTSFGRVRLFMHAGGRLLGEGWLGTEGRGASVTPLWPLTTDLPAAA
jgi:3',5'-cyclic-AMP phosphodiesterase